jgi:hypothetical protein
MPEFSKGKKAGIPAQNARNASKGIILAFLPFHECQKGKNSGILALPERKNSFTFPDRYLGTV